MAKLATKTIPYGNRAVLIGDRTVHICDRILLREDYPTDEALMEEVARVYREWQENFSG